MQTSASKGSQAPRPAWMTSSIAKMETELVAKYGESQRPRIQRGLKQVSEFWRASDGDQTEFEEFAPTNLAGDQATLDTMFYRYQHLLEQLNGHMHEIGREFRNQHEPSPWPGASL